jgi:hypothetical protein
MPSAAGAHRAAGSPVVPPRCIAEDHAADERLGRDPLALPIGMLLYQHMRRRSG